jgi:hypothetical protein
MFCALFIAAPVFIAPGAAASLKRSGGIQRSTGTNLNSSSGTALQKRIKVYFVKQVSCLSVKAVLFLPLLSLCTGCLGIFNLRSKQRTFQELNGLNYLLRTH